MPRLYDQTHLMAVPSSPARGIEAWCRNAASTINGILGGQDARPRVWADYLSNINAARVTGASQPSWVLFKDGLYCHIFSATQMNECWLSFHINHDIAIGEGRKLYPHVHWTANTANTGTARWGFEYSYAKGHQQGGVFPSTTTVYMEQAFSGTAFEHHIAEVSDDDAIDVVSEGIEVDGILLCRMFRDGAHVNDTLTAGAFAMFVDLHVEIERVGTKQKTPDFYS